MVGAGAGAAIGTVILPGIGTAIGAGVGAVAGKFSSKKSSSLSLLCILHYALEYRVTRRRGNKNVKRLFFRVKEIWSSNLLPASDDWSLTKSLHIFVSPTMCPTKVACIYILNSAFCVVLMKLSKTI